MLNVAPWELHLTLRANQGSIIADFQQFSGFFDARISKIYFYAIFPKHAKSIDKTLFAQIDYATMGGNMGFCIVRAFVKMLYSVDVGYRIIRGQQEI